MVQQFPNGTELEETIAFMAVADEHSFTRAAAALGRDASVLSKRVAALERRLGVRLIERTTRRLVLTEAGTAFLTRARSALTALADAESAASRAGDGTPRGTLRLTLPATFGRMWIAPILPEFLAAHPELRIEADYTNDFQDIVGSGYDAAIRIGAMPDSRLVARRIASHKRLLCAAPSYLDLHGIPETPEQLADHECLGFTGFASHPTWHLTNPATRKDVSVRTSSRLISNDSETLVQAALQGRGIMMCTDWLVGREISRGELVSILDAWMMEGEGAIHSVTPSTRLLASKTRAFIDWVAARFMPVPPWSRS